MTGPGDGGLPDSESGGPRALPTRGVLVDPGYLLTCTFDAMGPSCVLQDPDSGQEHRIDAFNRAAFLYAVMERTGPDNDGWVPCDAVARAVWGRRGSTNNVNTLVYRIRRELDAKGLRSAFLEVRKGHVRLAPPSAEPRVDHALDVERLNAGIAQYRAATTPQDREAARRRITTALERVLLADGLFLEPR